MIQTANKVTQTTKATNMNTNTRHHQISIKIQQKSQILWLNWTCRMILTTNKENSLKIRTKRCYWIKNQTEKI